MDKLRELVDKFCPDGVKYEPLSNKKFFKFYYGKGNNIPEDIGGKYDVYGANGVVSHINEYNCEDVSIIGLIISVALAHVSVSTSPSNLINNVSTPSSLSKVIS